MELRTEGLFPVVSVTERDRRYEAIRNQMRESNIDFLVLVGARDTSERDYGDVAYVARFGAAGFVSFPLHGDPALILNFGIHLRWYSEQSWIPRVEVGGRYSVDLLVREIQQAGSEAGTIGLVGNQIFPAEVFVALKERLPLANFELLPGFLKEIRMRKSDEEIALMEKAALISDMACEEMARSRIGMTEYEIHANFMHAMMRNGAGPDSWLMIETGADVYQATYYPSARRMEQGDIIINEVFCDYGGYNAHPHKAMSFGKPKPEYLDLYNATRKAYDIGASLMRPGLTVKELYDAMLAPIESAGYISGHPLFHGSGLTVPDIPVAALHWGLEWERVLEPNVIVILQPHACTPDRLKGIHIGDTFVITENGCRNLNRFPVDFIEVGSKEA